MQSATLYVHPACITNPQQVRQLQNATGLVVVIQAGQLRLVSAVTRNGGKAA